MTLASFANAGMQGVRLTKKKRIIKGVPRMTGTSVREVYWVFQGLTTSLEPGDALVMVSRDPVRTNAVLRVWAGLLPVDTGEVQRPQRCLFLVPPQNKWLRELSVEQTIRLLAGTYGLRDDEVEAILAPVSDMAGVTDQLHRRLEELGKPYAHQIAFAIAMHAPVDVVLFDHTATMGSREFRATCLDRLVSLRDAGKGLVIATDKPKVALHVGSKALIVRGKRADQVPVSEAAEFLIRDRIKGKKKPRRRYDEEEDEGDLGF